MSKDISHAYLWRKSIIVFLLTVDCGCLLYVIVIGHFFIKGRQNISVSMDAEYGLKIEYFLPTNHGENNRETKAMVR